MNNENNNLQENQQPQYQQPQYQQPQYPQYPQPQYQKPPRNYQDGRGLSIASLVIGCCSIVFCWTPVLNIILLACGIVAIIMGALGRKKSILAYGRASGIATAGLVLGIIGTVIAGIGTLSCIACVGCSSCSTCAMYDLLDISNLFGNI